MEREVALGFVGALELTKAVEVREWFSHHLGSNETPYIEDWLPPESVPCGLESRPERIAPFCDLLQEVVVALCSEPKESDLVKSCKELLGITCMLNLRSLSDDAQTRVIDARIRGYEAINTGS